MRHMHIRRQKCNQLEGDACYEEAKSSEINLVWPVVRLDRLNALDLS